MKILFLAPSFPGVHNNYGNPFFEEQAKALSSMHDVTVFAPELNKLEISLVPNFKVQLRKSGGLEIHILHIRRNIMPLYTTYSQIKIAIHYIENNLDMSSYDVIHCQNTFVAGYIGSKISKRYNIPYFITEHSSNFETNFRTLVHKYLVIKTLRNADGVITVGENLKEEISKYVKKRISVIPNVIDVERFELKKGVSGIKRCINIGFVGFLIERKGLDVLFKALKKMHHTDFHLKIVGSGILYENYQQLAEDLGISKKISFLGSIPPASIPNFFKELDIFVLPSKKESFGVVLIEALASGVPVISNPCGGPEHIIREGVGLLFDYQDDNDLSRKIDEMIAKLSTYEPSKLRNYVVENFGVKSFCEKITNEYRKVI